MAAGFGNIPPFFTNYGAASATSPGILTATGAQDIGGTIKNFTGLIRAQGSTTPATGIGLEMGHDGTIGRVTSFDRGATAYKQLSLLGSSIFIQPSGSTAVTINTSGTTFSGGIFGKVTTVTGAGPTTVAATDFNIVWKPTVTAAGQLNLPSAPSIGALYFVVDGKGIAAANTLTISGNGKTINGAASTTVTTNYGGVVLMYDGTEWHIIANF